MSIPKLKIDLIKQIDPNVSVKIIHKYLLYDELIDGKIWILTIRYGNKTPQVLKLE